MCKRGGPAFAIAVRDCHRFVRDVQEKHDDAGAAGDQPDLDEVVHLKDLSAD